FFEPVVFQQARELRIEFLIVLHTVDEVPLHHPLDVQRRQRNAERIVRENRAGNRLRRTDHGATTAESFFEFLAEALEQLNVFGLFTRELQQRAHAIIVAPELRPRVVQHERQYELFDKTEDAEIGVASDLIQRPPLFAVEK